MPLVKDLYSAHIKTDSTRQGFGDALVELGDKNKDILVLTADLKESTKVHLFAQKYPKRFIEMGIAEQNMVGVAAGLALNNKIPFMTSYAAFSPGYNWKQIRLNICYSNANVKIASSHSGLSASADGATHQGLEDLALIRVLPNITILTPADYNQAKKATEYASQIKGPVYIRLTRNKTPIFTTEKAPFEPSVLKKGSDVTIVAIGPVTYQAILAVRELSLNHNIEAELINYPIIKPFDEKLLIDSASKTGLVVTLEEHQTSAGFGGLVSEVLSENLPTKIHKMGIVNSFGQSGTYEELLEHYQLSSKHIVKKVQSLVHKK